MLPDCYQILLLLLLHLDDRGDFSLLVPQSNDFNHLNITHEFKYCLLDVITVGDGWYWLMRQKDVQQNHQIYQSILWILLLSPSIRCALCVCWNFICKKQLLLDVDVFLSSYCFCKDIWLSNWTWSSHRSKW